MRRMYVNFLLSIMLAFLHVVVTGAMLGEAADIQLHQFSIPFHKPIGIDFHEPNGGNLIMSANYPNLPPGPTGLPNLELVNISTAMPTQFSTLAGLSEELKIATVRNTANCQQFPIGDVFTGNGQPGEIVRLDKDGNIYAPAANNPGTAGSVAGVPHFSWVKLPGSLSQDLLRGSLFVDRFCAFGGDLIVVASDEDGFPTDGGGAVWRVKADGTAQLLTRILQPGFATCVPGNCHGIHLEGVITLPNDPKYGPWAGTIITGDENSNADATVHGRLWSITSAGLATPYDLSFNLPDGCVTGSPGCVTYPVKPEDLDLIEPGGDFYGVAFLDEKILTAPAANFAAFAGDILLTQEYPCANGTNGSCGSSVPTTGLHVVRFVGVGGNAAGGLFQVTPLNFSPSSPIQTVNQWEHVTISPRGDVQVTKSTPNTTPITAGDVATYNIVVQANGPTTSFNVVLTDQVPGGVDGGGWAVQVLPVGDQSKCSPNPVLGGGTLTCNFGDMASGEQKQITLTAKTTLASCPSIQNTAVVNSVNDFNSNNNSSGPITISVHCPRVKIEIAPDDTNEVGQPHTFTVTLSKDTGNGTFVPASGEHVVVTLTDTNGAGHTTPTGSCTNAGPNTNAAGQCTITFTSSTAGTVTGHASASLIMNGLTVSASTDGVSPNSDDAVKTFVDANIQITPPTATNPITSNHTLTGHVNVNNGSGAGYVNAPSGTLITFSLTNSGGATATFIGPNSCTTSGATGSCTVVISSPTAGATTIKATTTVIVGGVSLTRATGDGKAGDSADANKSWTSGKPISIGPSSMEGAIKISAGDWVNGGYNFKTNFTGNITITATVNITGACLDSKGKTLGTSDTITVPLDTLNGVTFPGGIPYSAVAGSDWKPTGDANSILSWQGAVRAPTTLCGGNGARLDASKGALFKANVAGAPTGGKVTFRFRYRDPAAKGKPNTNCLALSPIAAENANRDKADVCGASVSPSLTVTDP